MASLGTVSAIAGPLRLGNGRALERYLRTDATPYPGFSGGALIDMSGAVAGVLTTGLARGVTLAIPFDLALRALQKSHKAGVRQARLLGVVSQQVKLPSAQPPGYQETGLLVVRVESFASRGRRPHGRHHPSAWKARQSQMPTTCSAR
jgi:S1-C subfamily serine protease